MTSTLPLIVTLADVQARSPTSRGVDGRIATCPADRHVIVRGPGPSSSIPPWFDRPTLRAMRRGTERLVLGTRTVRLDEDACIVTGGRAARSSTYDDTGDVQPLLIAFAPEAFAAARAAARLGPDDEKAGDGDASEELERVHTEALHLQDATLARLLAQIEAGAYRREPDPGWWDERLHELMASVVLQQGAMRLREHGIAASKPATRRELLRRVLMASDFIQSHYQEPLSLAQIAMRSHLSRFHLIRLFRSIHGLTPYAYLTRKRTTVALRLIDQTELGLDEIAELAGFGTRSSLFRHLRRHLGHGAAVFRSQASGSRACHISV